MVATVVHALASLDEDGLVASDGQKDHTRYLEGKECRSWREASSWDHRKCLESLRELLLTD